VEKLKISEVWMKNKIKKVLNKFPYIRTLISNINKLESNLENYKKIYGTWVPPGHYYSPIPSLEELELKKGIIYDYGKKIQAIDLQLEEQYKLLKEYSNFYKELDFTKERNGTNRYFYNNPSFREPDGIFLYSFLRAFRPKRIIEVGSGYTSALMLDINDKYFNKSLELTFVDPFPDLLFSLLDEKDKAKHKLIPQKLQDVDLSIFDSLQAGDLVFIDSTHVSKTGSDVNIIFFDLIPRLKSGVFIHFHDIVFPFEYPEEWVFNTNGRWKGFSWNESFILRSFLMYNEWFHIIFFNSFMLKAKNDFIKQNMPLCLDAIPGSIYLKKLK
jgi:SAM-dependent methyltransferase